MAPMDGTSGPPNRMDGIIINLRYINPAPRSWAGPPFFGGHTCDAGWRKNTTGTVVTRRAELKYSEDS